ncbi:hypothetical protein [Nocardioides sp.]|uniref:hypothetical protein n=1 Tax=Nocardioides sp. TaxID=35761 RepID=UPI003D0FD366
MRTAYPRLWRPDRIGRTVAWGLLCTLIACSLGCGTDEAGPPTEPGRAIATVGDVRFSLPTMHQVVVEHRTADGWGDPRVVFEDRSRECGTVHALAAGPTVAATVGCDDHFAVDQMPTRSVALISTDGRTWTHRDLDGETPGTIGLSPRGGHAVWAQGDDLLTWEAGSFRTEPGPQGSAQVVTVDDAGTILGAGVGISQGRCAVEIRASEAKLTQAVVPVARSGQLQCHDIGLWLATPSEIQGDVSGQPGTEFVVRRTGAGGWILTARPPITAPGLAVYPENPDRAVWNQVTSNTGGDLVAVGSPDRRHVTAQRYDRSRQEWTPSLVVHEARTATCRRRLDDSGLLQGASFRLRLICDGRPIVLRSDDGATWTKQSPS